MKRTTIYLDPDLEVRLKSETRRRKQPMAEIVREAIEAYLGAGDPAGPPGAGAFASGRADTASRAEAILAETGFGAARRSAPRRPGKRA